MFTSFDEMCAKADDIIHLDKRIFDLSIATNNIDDAKEAFNDIVLVLTKFMDISRRMNDVLNELNSAIESDK